MRKDLTVDDLGDLAELRLLAALATYRQDGTVLLSPVWHEWRDGGFDVVTGSRGVKAAHLRRDPRASIVVCEHSPPYRGVELRCSAQLVTARRPLIAEGIPAQRCLTAARSGALIAADRARRRSCLLSLNG
jgi:Pyridoxamine 5'-phosphate oxidase